MTMLTSLVLITNIAYTAAFDTSNRCPAWVDYEITPEEVVHTRRMPIPFHTEPSLPEHSDNLDDYFHSGYDRGHLAPAADFNYDTNALMQTYSFANICPMSKELNRGPWKDLEAHVRDLAEASNTVRVITFPIYLGEPRFIKRVRIPDGFAKVLILTNTIEVYTMPNK